MDSVILMEIVKYAQFREIMILFRASKQCYRILSTTAPFSILKKMCSIKTTKESYVRGMENTFPVVYKQNGAVCLKQYAFCKNKKIYSDFYPYYRNPINYKLEFDSANRRIRILTPEYTIYRIYNGKVEYFEFAKLLFVVGDFDINVAFTSFKRQKMLYIFNKYSLLHEIQLPNRHINIFFNDHFAIVSNVLFLRTCQYCRISFGKKILYADEDDIVWYDNGAVHMKCEK